MDFVSPLGPLPPIPDDLSIPQFLLDSWHPIRPVKQELTPWFIEDATGKDIGYEEVRARVFGLANELKSRWNVGENDVVCIFSPNHVDYPIAIWAVHRLGAIVTTANPAYTADELVYQIKATNASILLAHSGNLSSSEEAARLAGISSERIVLIDSPAQSPYNTVEKLLKTGLSKPAAFVERRLNPGESKTKLAFLCFSSGTTGRPKAVAIPHYSVIANVIQISFHGKTHIEYTSQKERRYVPGDVTIAVLPFYHIYGLVINMHFMLFYGATLVITHKFNLADMLRSIERYRITHLFLVPPMVVLLCKSPLVKNYDLSSVKAVMCGAAPLSAELTRQFVKVLPQASIGQGYGMTETCTSVTFTRLDQKIGTLGSAGRLLPGETARVLKPDGSYAGYNEPGELIVKGPSMALCYLNNAEATKETFIHFEGDPDRWVRTGDEVMINELAEVFVLDRIKEIMKVRGFQVAPAELEGLLLDHPDVDDACVVGVPDEYSGEIPMAFIVPSRGAVERMAKDKSEVGKLKAILMKYVADNKVRYKRLAGGVELVDSIPKNPSGKLLRRFLRDKAKAMRAASTSASAVRARL